MANPDETPSLKNLIKKSHSRVFRRFKVKRRQLSDGLFESEFQDLSRFVKTWGTFGRKIDYQRQGVLVFQNAGLTVSNETGSFNPNDNASSFWSGFADVQRSLVQIEAGFIHQTLGADGIWVNTEYPANPVIWKGIINGDIYFSGSNEVFLPLKPITQVFRDFPANDLGGDNFPIGGISSGGWFEILRDHTDGAGNFVFRPFIGDGNASDWSITTDGNLYSNLNSATAEQFSELDCWDVSERLAKSEDKIALITKDGKLEFRNKSTTASVIYEFHGLGSESNREFGHTIKRINRFGKRLTGFYSRVAVKFVNEDTSTSFVNTGLAFAINGTNTAWNLGRRTFRVDNFWLQDSAAAAVVADALFQELSNQVNELDFTTSLVPHLNILDRISVTYDGTDFSSLISAWDINVWSNDAGTTPDPLFWDRDRRPHITE